MENMWRRIETWGKAHPFALGLIVFAVGALLIYLFTRGSATGTATTTGVAQPSDAYYAAQAAVTASGNQLQAAQLAAQAQSNYAGDQLQAAQDQIGGQVALAQIGAQQATTVASLSADVQKQAISAQQEMTDTASTLTAKVQQAGIDAQTQINQQNNAAVTSQAQIAANEQVGLASTNAQLQESSIQAQSQAIRDFYNTQQAQIGSTERIAAGAASLAFYRPGASTTVTTPSFSVSTSP